MSAGHTFYLEELERRAGDFVSYYARAADNDAVQGGKKATSDIYFLQVRPLKKDFKRAESQAGRRRGGGGAEPGRRAVAAAAPDHRGDLQHQPRSQDDGPPEKLKENVVVVALSQSKLREQVEGLLTRMNSRLVEQDPAFKKIAELLPQAVSSMTAAEGKLRAAGSAGALEPEQKALQVLQKAEEEYEVQVSQQRGGGGGGGGGQSATAQELADIFEMELDRSPTGPRRAQRAEQLNTDQKVDELMEKLRELARRQEQEAERQRQRALAGPAVGWRVGSHQQRALARAGRGSRPAARAAVARGEPRTIRADGAAAARCGRCDAARVGERQSVGGRAGRRRRWSGLQRSRAGRLQQTQTGRAERDVRNARQQAEEIAREQREIAEGAARDLRVLGAQRRSGSSSSVSGRRSSPTGSVSSSGR